MWRLKSEKKTTSGVALVITLILLAVVTVMAVAFLANSRRERGAVTTTTDTANARLAADAALASAEAQILANVLATTNPYSFGLLVSTNVSFFTNVPVDLTNLYAFPRTPVFVSTNTDTTKPLDFRFYLDLNRNGQFETNGWVTNLDNLGNVIFVNGNPSTNLQVGDPEWIGILNHPDQPYGPNNPFIARYAFFAVPMSGNTMDLNYIHNQARSDESSGPVNSTTVNDTFMRNQGVGSWEINLAAFLADLNTNQWLPVIPPANLYYAYNEPFNNNPGRAFDDARALLAYRYANDFGNLQNADLLFANSPSLQKDNIDEYSDGPLQITTSNIDESITANQDVTGLPWAGADNTNHFFDLQDLFDPTKTTNGVSIANFNAGNYVSGRLLSAGNGVSTYDRYTFYRLAGQLGVESTPEQGKININYSNAAAFFDANGVLTNITYYPNAETNLMSWQPLQFFTIAADRMLRMYSQDWLARDPSNYVASYNFTNVFSLTNIPVMISNKFVYSSAINRVLQLAANICDATTNTSIGILPDYPDVFRPNFYVVLENGYTNVYINSYQLVGAISGDNDFRLTTPIETTFVAPDFGFGIFTNLNVYGVPWIIGAKKGFPNFNQVTIQTAAQLTRKIQVTRTNIGGPFGTNQMYILSVSNLFGVECWNSYTNNYPRVGTGPIDIIAHYSVNQYLTNDAIGAQTVSNNTLYSITNSISLWPGYQAQITNSFILPFPVNSASVTLTNSVYYFGPGSYTATNGQAFTAPCFIPAYLDPSNFLDSSVTANLPHFGLQTTNRLQLIMIDYSGGLANGRIIDYVELGGMDNSRDLNAEIFGPDSTEANGLWNTNLMSGGLSYGINQQLLASGNPTTFGASDTDTGVGPTAEEQAKFKLFFSTASTAPYLDGSKLTTITNSSLGNKIQGWTITRTRVLKTTWQANDPLVHYLTSDLNDFAQDTNVQNQISMPLINLTLNERYKPWSQAMSIPNTDSSGYNTAFKDSLVYSSDDWDFPTNKMPGVGWLGRVHRGTPWQTVYLKAANILNEANGINTWGAWTGNLNPVDAISAGPVQDRKLFDIFTTAFNDNATRGQLSVNVGANNNINLAAWSALFSGMVVLSNNAEDGNIALPQHNGSLTNYTWNIINPAGSNGTNSALGQLVVGINTARANFTNNDGLVGVFEHEGDILSTPQLTEESPFLNWNDVAQQHNGVSDEMYEWLPQQMMSLLRAGGTPESPMRYAIYCYGQTLKPAPNSIVTSGTFFGMCTNYQVVSEVATRAVVRFNSTHVENTFLTNGVIAGTLVWTNIPAISNNTAVIESFNVLPPN
ncbi:MAG TPA: hypothetical protein VHG89_09455 [Verrucomicrobiae bacterium]|nr:hypothetical protein [Verrucomicrobiae bacterium]